MYLTFSRLLRNLGIPSVHGSRESLAQAERDYADEPMYSDYVIGAAVARIRLPPVAGNTVYLEIAVAFHTHPGLRWLNWGFRLPQVIP